MKQRVALSTSAKRKGQQPTMSAYRKFTVAQQAFEHCLNTLASGDPLTLWAAQRADLLYKKMLAQPSTRRGY